MNISIFYPATLTVLVLNSGLQQQIGKNPWETMENGRCHLEGVQSGDELGRFQCDLRG